MLKIKKKSVCGQGPSGILKELTVPIEKVKIEKAVTTLVEPICESAGMELVLVELRREPGGRILRIYIDRPASGITLDDCTLISQQVTHLLDVRLEAIGPYNLEISSPGIQRPLVKPADYKRFAGQPAYIQLKKALDGRKKFKGTLGVVTDETIQIETESGTVSFDFKQIARARLNI